MDLINSLPRGAQKRMTEIIDLSAVVISKVLNGKINANTETTRWVIILAEQMVKREKLKNMEPQKKYDILELSKMSVIDLTSIADQAQIEIQPAFKQGLIYAILDHQHELNRPKSELNSRDRYAVADSITDAKTA